MPNWTQDTHAKLTAHSKDDDGDAEEEGEEGEEEERKRERITIKRNIIHVTKYSDNKF